MTEISIELYEDLLKQFYRKIIKNHPNRQELITKFIKFSMGMKQDKSMESQRMLSTTTKPRPSLNPLTISENGKNKAATTRDPQPHSAKFSKKLSEDKSQISADDFDIGTSQKRNKDQQKYFNCQWVYKSNNFKKTVVYAFIYLYFQSNDLYNFRKLRQNIEIYFEDSQNIDAEMRSGAMEWSKLDQTFDKKDRVRWVKILPEIFVNFSVAFINVIFECLTRIKMEQIRNPSKQLIESMSRNMKTNICYFEIFHLDIEKQYEKSDVYKIDIYIGYVREQDCYVLSNKQPQKSQVERKKDKTIRNISEAIGNLLREYDANTEKLMSLQILSEVGSKESNIRSYLNKKDGIK